MREQGEKSEVEDREDRERAEREQAEAAIEEALSDEWPMAAFGLNDWADVDALADYQYMLRKPLCLVSGDAELLEAGLRVYQGRALYEGSLTDEALAPLQDKYGLII